MNLWLIVLAASSHALGEKDWSLRDSWDKLEKELSNDWGKLETELSNDGEKLEKGLSKGWEKLKKGWSNDWEKLQKGVGNDWEKLENGLSNDWSEEEHSNEINDPSSELGSSEESYEVVKKEEMEDKSDISKLFQGASKEGNGDKLSDSRKEPSHVIWSYVLWRPKVWDDEDKSPFMDLSDVWPTKHLTKYLETGGEKVEQGRGGWREDRTQLDLPRVDALTSNDENSYLNDIGDTLANWKESIQRVSSMPDFRQNVLYIVMGLTAFLILFVINENIFKNTEPRTIQDHYILPDTGLAAKLPTYEECIKADKTLLVNMDDTVVFNKVDLSLPVVAVDAAIPAEKETEN